MTNDHEAHIPTASGTGEGWIKRVIALGCVPRGRDLALRPAGALLRSGTDEALTALPALGVWRTGDTTAVVGDNIVGYLNGSLLVGPARATHSAPGILPGRTIVGAAGPDCVGGPIAVRPVRARHASPCSCSG